jgi:large conductance mechanosensitive channel
VLKEFRDFIARGNVVELAVAVVIGVAFNNVVNAVVEGLITPLIGVFGSHDFSALDFTINKSTFEYGEVINALLQFLSVALAVFFIFVKPMNMWNERRRRGEVTVDEVSDEVALLAEIRDLLRSQQQPVRAQQYAQPPQGQQPAQQPPYRDGPGDYRR